MEHPSNLVPRSALGKAVGLNHLTARYWARLAHEGRGPSYYLIAGEARYDLDEVVAWLRSCRVVPAAPATPAHAPAKTSPRRRRGRPTKTEQAARRRSGGEG